VFIKLICSLSCLDQCSQVKDEGICPGNVPRFYFDKTAERCLLFSYGGCGGNTNNFVTEEGCISTCGGPAGALLHAIQLHGNIVISFIVSFILFIHPIIHFSHSSYYSFLSFILLFIPLIHPIIHSFHLSYYSFLSFILLFIPFINFVNPFFKSYYSFFLLFILSFFYPSIQSFGHPFTHLVIHKSRSHLI